MASFNRWIDTFLDEKGIDGEETLEVEASDGTTNIIPVGCLVEAFKGTSTGEQRAIKRTLVLIDFKNGDVRHYLTHLAKAIALPLGVERIEKAS